MLLISQNTGDLSRERLGTDPVAGTWRLVLLMLLPFLTCCSPNPLEEPPQGAIGRLAGLPRLAGLSDLGPTQPITIGEQTRQATVLLRGNSLTMEIPKGSMRIALSLAELGAPRPALETGAPDAGLELLVEIDSSSSRDPSLTVSYTHLTLPTKA